MTDNQKTKKAVAKGKRKPEAELQSIPTLPTPPKRTAKKTRDARIEAEFDRLAEQAEFLDRQAAEDAIHRKPPMIGISDLEPELELGRRIQEAREGVKLTQGELAELTKLADSESKGISRAVLSFYETGKSRPSPRELRILCEALRVSPNQLIYGTEDPFENFFERYRFGGFATTDPEFYALLTYAFSKQHPHNRIAVMQLMNSLLQGWEKTWTLNTNEANNEFLRMADKLRALLAKRTDRKK